MLRLRCRRTRFIQFSYIEQRRQHCPQCNAHDSVEHLLLHCSNPLRHVMVDEVCALNRRTASADDDELLDLLLGSNPNLDRDTQRKAATLVAHHACESRQDEV